MVLGSDWCRERASRSVSWPGLGSPVSHAVLGLRCWHSSQMSPIGEKKMNSQAFPSGMRFFDVYFYHVH